MKIAVIDSAYWGVLEKLDLSSMPRREDVIEDLQELYTSNSFDAATMYAKQFRAKGHEVEVIVPNARRIQLLKENSVLSLDFGVLSWKRWQIISRVPVIRTLFYENSRFAHILLTEINRGQFDLLFVLDPNLITPKLGKRISAANRTLKIVGQIASPLPPDNYFFHYDLMISAHPEQVDYFCKLGIRSLYLPLAIDDELIPKVSKTFADRTIDIAFVGSFGRHHESGNHLLREVSKKFPGFRIFTLSSVRKLKRLGLHQAYAGSVWGKEMMGVYGDSKIVLNRHIDMSKNYSVNFRMFESTASGAVLLTEDSKNISSLFTPGKEILTYNSINDALEKIERTIANPDVGDQISKAGLRATKSRHTMSKRAAEVLKVFDSLIK